MGSSSVSGKVVEYLVPVMSKDLLCKFPDNSAYGFDYSQSSIWSPLVPRIHTPAADFDSHVYTPKIKKKLFSISPSSIRMTSASAFKKKRMRAKKKKAEVSVVRTPSFKCACLPPFATKGLNRVLRAATKHLKKKMRRDSLGRHVKLCNYLEAS